MGLAVIAIVSIALFRPQSSSSYVRPEAETLVTPAAEPVVAVVSILSDSHAYNADSWWRQTMESHTVPGSTMGSFESTPGADTQALVPHLDDATERGGYVIVQAGTNNLLSAQSPEDALAGIVALWDGIAAREATPVAALVPPSATRASGVLELNRLITSEAAARGLPLVDVYSPVAAADGDWADGMSGDGVHANKAGSDRMASVARTQMTTMFDSSALG